MIHRADPICLGTLRYSCYFKTMCVLLLCISLGEKVVVLFIKKDEILTMKKQDFFDTAHTTPQGSKRIAETIFPLLIKFFEENNEINKR